MYCIWPLVTLAEGEKRKADRSLPFFIYFGLNGIEFMAGMNRYLILVVLAAGVLACKQEMNEEEVTEYKQQHAAWQENRIEKLKAHDGYLNLAGLYWLKKGVNTLGSGGTNSIIFPPHAPPSVGTLRVTNTLSVLFEPAPDVVVDLRSLGKDSSWQASEIQLVYDDSLRLFTQMRHNELAWNIIKRGVELGVRLRNYRHPKLDSLQSIEYFPVDISWRTIAEFEPYLPPKILTIENILGTTYETASPGRLVFEKAGREFALDVTEEGDEFFVTFSDETTGEETYGGGRYLYTTKPDKNGKVVLDFNKAYNPPCVYTAYATCPLPPPQNKLSIAVVAGEIMSKP